MSRVNVAPASPATHEGGKAKRIPAIAQLRRSVCSCMLWEREFYEDGQEIAGRILNLSREVGAMELADLAWETRHTHHMRHVPLLLLAGLAVHHNGKNPELVRNTIAETLGRADEPGEFLAIYARLTGTDAGNLKKTLSASVKRGVARAFGKFDAYQLGKWNRSRVGVSLKDVLNLTHPKPRDAAQSALWKSLLEDTLPSPDTWEVALSGGADKKATFERLLSEGRLGYMALLRNLRNMAQSGVDETLVKQAIVARRGAHNVLPFRYLAAARAAPQWEPQLDEALLACIDENVPRLEGRTLVLVDVSSSMRIRLSGKSDLTRMDAGAALAAIVPGGDVRMFSFSEEVVEVPPRKGMAGIDAVVQSQSHRGTYLGGAVKRLNGIPHDRLIVVSDEQSMDPVPDPVAKSAYMVNVASYENGVGYGKWVHIDGFSENVLKFIQNYERERDAA